MLPLSALDFHVLLVLSREDLWGYAILKAVEDQSGGLVTIGIGSLYRVLSRLMDAGLVAEADTPADAPEVHRGRERRYYRLTERGLQVANAEAKRLARVVALARDLLPGAVAP
jgi:DNA-binding PadR family transcriptional regulator